MTDREAAKVSMTVRKQPCAPEREQYSEKVHVPLYQLNERGPPFAQTSPHPQLGGGGGGGTKVDDEKCPCCGPKKLVQFFDKKTFSP
ncbi:hypothetical protein NQZ68_016612 [Dissostichus eleginoides]|nr:hypothetical protein NQZ68_016612 [Dissostichus eleginoides]